MKMRKLLSLLISGAMILSMTSVSCAYTKSPTDENVTVYVEATSVDTTAGTAKLTLKLSSDSAYDMEETGSDDDGNTFYKGSGVIQYTLNVTPNSSYFGNISAVAKGYNKAKNPTNNTTYATFTYSWSEDGSAVLVKNNQSVGIITVPLKDTSMTLDDLKAKTDLVSYGYCSVNTATITADNVGCATGDFAYLSRYNINGEAGTKTDYPLVVKTGAEPKLTVSTATIPEDQPAKRTWTVKVPAELMNGTFKAQLINTSKDNATTADNELAFETGVAYSGTGEATFNVWTMIKNEANNSDDLQLKFTANGQSATN